MHLLRPNEPGSAIVTANEICTASKKSAGFVRHIEFDLSNTPIAGHCVPGQSIGIIPPGTDSKGKPHKVRLYSLASPTNGSDGKGNIHSTTVKRVVDENWDNHKLFLGVASNFICDCQVGDELIVTGPAGKRFVLPEDVNAHDYLFFATGTGIAPFRAMALELLESGCTRQITLIMGAPYATDLIYHDLFTDLAGKHANFTYLTAVSREKFETRRGLYVQDTLDVYRDQLQPQFELDTNLIYVCGIAGMELGIFQKLAASLPHSALEQYLRIDPQVMTSINDWDRKMINKKINPTRRVMLEVYA